MGRDRAAYMREYRARKKTRTVISQTVDGIELNERIAELKAEVAHLKRQLAQQSDAAPHVEHRAAALRTAQATRDAWLRRVNRR